MEIYHQYVKLRRHFGRWPKVVDEGAEMIADVRPNEEHAERYIERCPVTTCAQVVPDMSEHDANTNEVLYSKHNINHEEGGWPKDVDYTEAEHTIRFRKKVEKDEDYIRTVVGLGDRAEARAKQNNAIDIYQQYYTTGLTDVVAQAPKASTVTMLYDPTPITRSVNMTNWNGEGSKVATAYAIMDFQQQPDGMSLDSYVWDLGNPNEPEYTMQPLSQVVSAKFNLKDPNIVGAGLYNGQFAVFDMRKGNRQVDVTPMDLSHTEPIYDFEWLQSKTGTELMTVASDGLVLWWDIRMFGDYVERLSTDKSQEIIENLPLKEKGSEHLQGGVCFAYDPAAGATKFMVGCESGTVLACNRKAKNPIDRVAGAFSGHHGPVYSLHRHPFAAKYFLSVGDWTARIWAEDSKQPLITSRYHNTYLTGGSWSMSRPGVFFTTRQDGCLDVWDLYFKHQEPTLQVQVASAPLTCVANSSSGEMLAVGSSRGACSIVQLNEAMWVSPKEEKSAINAMLEREGLREKNLEKTIKEARLKAKKEANRKDGAADAGAACEEDLDQLEEGFYSGTGASRGVAAMPVVAAESAPLEGGG